MKRYMHISETFYSVQGEGVFSGRPSWFIRLAGCPIACAWCDTTETWKRSMEAVPLTTDCFAAWANRTINAIYPTITVRDWRSTKKLRYARPARIVFTGGEPLWASNRKSVEFWLSHNPSELTPWDSCDVEIETAGVHGPLSVQNAVGARWRVFYTVSPKPPSAYAKGILSPREYVDLWKGQHPQTLQWKFPLAVKDGEVDQSDASFIFDVVSAYLEESGWPLAFSVMPVCSSRESLTAASEAVARFCLDYGFNFSSRLQLAVWDQATGV